MLKCTVTVVITPTIIIVQHDIFRVINAEKLGALGTSTTTAAAACALGVVLITAVGTT